MAMPGPDWIRKNESRCRSCGAPIIWWITPAGRRSPHDPDGTSHFATCPHAERHRQESKPDYGPEPDTAAGRTLVKQLDDAFTRISLRIGNLDYHPGRAMLNQVVRDIESEARS
jgi:hypothetical protein